MTEYNSKKEKVPKSTLPPAKAAKSLPAKTPSTLSANATSFAPDVSAALLSPISSSSAALVASPNSHNLKMDTHFPPRAAHFSFRSALGDCTSCGAVQVNLFFKHQRMICLKCYHSLVPTSVPATRTRVKPSHLSL